MNHPAYHLRVNKAADRFSLIEAIRHLGQIEKLEEYTYVCLGGPYLEDCRSLYEVYPEIEMISIEEDYGTYIRQQFHLPCGTIQLKNLTLSSFIKQTDFDQQKCIFWLDYTRLEHNCFVDFKTLLEKVVEKSMIKITLQAEPKYYWRGHSSRQKERREDFREKFRDFMPDPSANPPKLYQDFAYLLQGMIEISAQQALPPEATNLKFQPISSFYYSDGTGMFSLTGVVCSADNQQEIINAFSDWEFANLNWAKPKFINVPVLSTKERLQLQRYLPCHTSAGQTLHSALGHLVAEDKIKTEAALEQYAAFHRYSPYFIRGIP